MTGIFEKIMTPMAKEKPMGKPRVLTQEKKQILINKLMDLASRKGKK